ncbi:MAG TPA: hypothetical protein VIM74_07190 [Casimicrobiaceae bacterium]
MRVLIIFAGASLALTGCGKSQQAGTSQNSADLTAGSIVANDVTAIDAVTGDAANMAADVNYTLDENSLGNESNSVDSKPAANPAAKPSAKTPPPAQTNSTGNAAE